MNIIVFSTLFGTNFIVYTTLFGCKDTTKNAHVQEKMLKVHF